MQEMMNDTAELITEANNGDDLPVIPYEEVQPEEQEKSELDKLKEELSAVTYDDILNSTAPYEKILTLPDEFAVLQYITVFRQVAKKFKLTADFDSLVAPYREKALVVAEAPKPLEINGSCIRTFECGRIYLCPFLPLASSSAAILAAIPTQYISRSYGYD